MAQRISRAKRTVSGVRFDQPGDVATVLRVLYLVFNEGYSGDVDLAAEAIRLTRQLAAAIDHPEVAGLLALMLLHHARRAARTAPDGSLVPLAEQDRGRWDTSVDRRGRRDPAGGPRPRPARRIPGPGRHRGTARRRATAEETDWVQIVEWYDELARLTDSPVVRLNRAVAVGEADGPRAGLAALAALDDSLPRHDAVAAYLHERDGDLATAARLYAEAARQGTQPRRTRPPDPPSRPAQRGTAQLSAGRWQHLRVQTRGSCWPEERANPLQAVLTAIKLTERPGEGRVASTSSARSHGLAGAGTSRSAKAAMQRRRRQWCAHVGTALLPTRMPRTTMPTTERIAPTKSIFPRVRPVRRSERTPIKVVRARAARSSSFRTDLGSGAGRAAGPLLLPKFDVLRPDPVTAPSGRPRWTRFVGERLGQLGYPIFEHRSTRDDFALIAGDGAPTSTRRP